jgi:hypothetical protein
MPVIIEVALNGGTSRAESQGPEDDRKRRRWRCLYRRRSRDRSPPQRRTGAGGSATTRLLRTQMYGE